MDVRPIRLEMFIFLLMFFEVGFSFRICNWIWTATQVDAQIQTVLLLQLPDNELDQSMNAVARMEKQPVSPSETAQLAQLKLTSPVLMSDLTEVLEV